MKDLFDKIFAWIKANLLLSIGILVAVVVLFFPKLLKGLTGRRRVRHRPGYYTARSGRTLPRSVGTHRVRKQYTKGGRAKKPWQIKGSEAARRHMAKIRRMR